MQRRPSRVLAASAAALTAVTLSACASSDRDSGGGGEGGEAQSGGTLVFGATGDPSNLDPAFASDGETFRVLRQIYDGLLQPAEGSTEAEPDLAEGYEVSDDGLEYTFTLRDGVTFHDGTDFNAEAVCFNFERWYNFTGLAQSPSASSYYQDVFGGFADTPDVPNIYAGCEATDELTAVIRLNRVTSKFPAALTLPAFSMQSPTALQEYDADNLSGNEDAFTYSEYGLEHPTGTGPFRFDSWDRGNGQITIVRNDEYWGEPALLDEIVFRTIPDGNTRRQELQAGTIDGYDFVAPADYGTLEGEGAQVLVRDPFNILYLGINAGNVAGTNANPALQDPRIRQAIAHAIDRQTIVNSLLPEGAEVATQFMPPTVDGWADDVTTYDYDPERARQLIDEVNPASRTLRFYYPTDVTRPYLPDPAAMFQAISEDLSEVGFTIEPTALQWNPDYLQAAQAGQADVHLLGWTGDYNDAYNFIGTFFAAKADGLAKAEFGAFDAPEVFAALDRADAEPDPANRTALYQEANRLIMDYLPAVPVSHSPPALVVAEDVQGLTPSPLTAEDFSTVSLTS
ncbi:peptide/nickel transport system substrate-binding protein [Geodermatophilus pulveris]|uniref:Peptide/nickel transport system substrate-binding protein n=1 Tax=Geodermatophilus pulveris TaxID=1564159 RepID=A0A239G5Q3_9ACTN|nr:ABC transporter substrate-binding protein [Geodermatophilus pulveris]SNS64479.1 peptide/nickel transport system substrate-binding protein [Geodermatophilus pulveris]